MTFRVTYPIGSRFAASTANPDEEPFEDFTDDDAFAFLPGGVLGIWKATERRSYFLPDGHWVMVSATDDQQPGMRAPIGTAKWKHALHLLTPPLM